MENILLYSTPLTVERFWEKVLPGETCLLWYGANNGRYGHFRFMYHKFYTHRASWIWSNEALIPGGYEIDHTCQTPLCVNPEHLDVVTPVENQLRKQLRKTHCKHGHEWREDNWYWSKGKRKCKPCAYTPRV